MNSRKPIYNIENVFANTGTTNLYELYDLGYDVRQYIRRRKIELKNELELLSNIDEELEEKESSNHDSRREFWSNIEKQRQSSRSNYRSDEDEFPFYGSWNPGSENYIGT